MRHDTLSLLAAPHCVADIPLREEYSTARQLGPVAKEGTAERAAQRAMHTAPRRACAAWLLVLLGQHGWGAAARKPRPATKPRARTPPLGFNTWNKFGLVHAQPSAATCTSGARPHDPPACCADADADAVDTVHVVRMHACTVVPSCSGISGQVLMETADRFVALGLDKLGYVMPLPVLTCVRTVWPSAPFNRAHARRTNFVLRS